MQGSFWQKRYYDRNLRDEREFGVKLRDIHRNPVKRGLCDRPEDWKSSSFRHYTFGEKGVVDGWPRFASGFCELTWVRNRALFNGVGVPHQLFLYLNSQKAAIVILLAIL